VFGRFEKLVHPYPDALPPPPPRSFFAFLWTCSKGVRPWLLMVTLFTAAIGAFEALLFSMMAHVVDLLAKVQPTQLWAEHGHTLKLLAGVLVASVAFAALLVSERATVFDRKALALQPVDPIEAIAKQRKFGNDWQSGDQKPELTSAAIFHEVATVDLIVEATHLVESRDQTAGNQQHQKGDRPCRRQQPIP
jgi:hypothetical protein